MDFYWDIIESSLAPHGMTVRHLDREWLCGNDRKPKSTGHLFINKVVRGPASNEHDHLLLSDHGRDSHGASGGSAR